MGLPWLGWGWRFVDAGEAGRTPGAICLHWPGRRRSAGRSCPPRAWTPSAGPPTAPTTRACSQTESCCGRHSPFLKTGTATKRTGHGRQPAINSGCLLHLIHLKGAAFASDHFLTIFKPEHEKMGRNGFLASCGIFAKPSILLTNWEVQNSFTVNNAKALVLFGLDPFYFPPSAIKPSFAGFLFSQIWRHANPSVAPRCGAFSDTQCAEGHPSVLASDC